MRILAIYFVMFNHTGENGFLYYTVADTAPKQLISLFLTILCKTAVPIFYMITGALQLGKEEPIEVVLKKRFLKFLLILVVISTVYWMHTAVRVGYSQSPVQFLKKLYSKGLSTPLWYLYSYLAILLMLPLLRRLAQSMSYIHYLYLAVMALVFMDLLPLFELFFLKGNTTIHADFRPALFLSREIVFLLMGYGFEHIMPEHYFRKQTVGIAIVAGILGIAVCSFTVLYCVHNPNELNVPADYPFHNCLIALPTYAIYFSAKYLFSYIKLSHMAKICILKIGRTVFGIYLLERILRVELNWIFTTMEQLFPTLIACLIWIFCLLVIGSIVVMLLKKIPVVRLLF